MGKGLEIVGGRLAADLAAQVIEVIRAQKVPVGGVVDGLHQLLDMPGDAVVVILDLADPEGVEHGRDARCGNLSVVRDDGRQARPLDPRPGHDMALQVVGVELDQPGNKVIAIQVLRAAYRRRARVDIDNAALAQAHCPRNDLRRRDDAGVGEDRFGHGLYVGWRCGGEN